MSLLLGGLGLAGTTSCVDILDDNENPDKPSTISPEVGLPVVVFYAKHRPIMTTPNTIFTCHSA